RVLGLDEAVDADHGLLAPLDRLEPPRVRLDQLLLEIPGVDRRNCAAHLFDADKLLARLALELLDLALDLGRAVEDVAVVEQVGSRRKGSAVAAAPPAGPTAAAGRAPRSTPATGPRALARGATGSPPASRSGCARRCSPAAAR